MFCLLAASSASFAIPSDQFLLSLRICLFTSRSLALYSTRLFSFSLSESDNDSLQTEKMAIIRSVGKRELLLTVICSKMNHEP